MRESPHEPELILQRVQTQRARSIGRVEFGNSILYSKDLQAQAAFTVVVVDTAILIAGLLLSFNC
jgi:hypothetical protein